MVSLRYSILWPSILLMGAVNLCAQQVRPVFEPQQDSQLSMQLLSMIIQREYGTAGDLFERLNSIAGTDWKATLNFMLNDRGEPAIPFELDIEFSKRTDLHATFLIHNLPKLDALIDISCRNIGLMPLSVWQMRYRNSLGVSACVEIGTGGKVDKVKQSGFTALTADLLIEGPDLTIAQVVHLLEKHGHTSAVVRDDPSVLPRMIVGRILTTDSGIQVTLHLSKPERESVSAGNEWSTRTYDGFTLEYVNGPRRYWMSAMRQMNFSWGVGGYTVPMVVPISMDPCR